MNDSESLITGPTPFGLRLSMPQSRREAVRLGLFSMAGMMSMAGCRPKPEASTEEESGVRRGLPGAKAKSIIQIFLWGGMSHNDTWDPKPDAGQDYNGPMRTFLKTNVDGIQLSGWFPKLAEQADKYSLIRSMTHRINGHETAAYMVQTAHAPGERLAYPSLGAVFTYFTKDSYKGVIPPYVVLTKPQGRFSEEGFLGPRYKPFATGSDPNAPRFEVEGIISKKITDDRQQARRDLLKNLNTMSRSLTNDPTLIAAEAEKQRAYDLILGESRDVFDLSKEDSKLRDKYGRHTFGQDCLAARRMVEAGVPYIVINYPGGWDTHSNHFQRMGRQCPQLDQGLAVLLEDLKDRGLLDSTLVWCSGEFGRGPKIDWQPPWNGGRNHYGACFSALVAGGGFKGGQVVGESDAKAMEVKDRPVYPVDLLGSIYKLAGIDPAATLPHPMGLDAHVLPEVGGKIKSGGLLEEIM